MLLGVILLLRSVLTEREVQVCRKIIEGKSNRVIAHELFISVTTVKTHIHNILNKLELRSRYQIKFLLDEKSNI
jgi:two-component system, NarL family, response regulator LiaR